MVSSGVTANVTDAVLATFRSRYFGRRPLIEDNSARSDSTLLFDGRIGYQWKNSLFAADVLNIFDSEDHDIDYFYPSRLPGELAEGVEDIHFHPVEPRTVRVSLSSKF